MALLDLIEEQATTSSDFRAVFPNPCRAKWMRLCDLVRLTSTAWYWMMLEASGVVW